MVTFNFKGLAGVINTDPGVCNMLYSGQQGNMTHDEHRLGDVGGCVVCFRVTVCQLSPTTVVMVVPRSAPHIVSSCLCERIGNMRHERFRIQEMVVNTVHEPPLVYCTQNNCVGLSGARAAF